MNRAVEIMQNIAYVDNLSDLFEQLVWRYGSHFEATWNASATDTLPAATPTQKQQFNLDIELEKADNLDEPIEL